MNNTENTQGIGRLVSKLKKEDANYSRIVKSIQIVYGILIPVLLVLTVIEYMDTKELIRLLSGFCNVVALVLIVVGFRKIYKEYKYVDYSLPVVQMLRNAINRWQPFRPKATLVYLGVLLIDVGLTLERLDRYSIWETQIFYGGAIALGAVIGLIWWYIQFKPLRDESKRLLREIES